MTYQVHLRLSVIDLILDAGKLQVWSWSSLENCQSENAHLDAVTTLQVGECHGNRTVLASRTFRVCPLEQHMVKKKKIVPPLKAEVLPGEESLESSFVLAIFKHSLKFTEIYKLLNANI